MYKIIDEADIQGNILKSHGREFTNFLFLKFNKEKSEEIKNWISIFAFTRVVSSKKQKADSDKFRPHRYKFSASEVGQEFVISFMLSAEGYRVLGVPDSETPDDEGFLIGMRGRRKVLKDRSDRYWQGRDTNNRMYAHNYSALILVAHSNKSELDTCTYNILKETIPFLDIHEETGPVYMVESGQTLKKQFHENSRPASVDIFGFADNLSQPDISTDSNALKKLLYHENKYSSEPNRFGSFVVFRKYKQDKARFEKLIEKIVKALGLKGKEATALVEAQIFGRFRDGTPIARFDRPKAHPENWKDVDFTYRGDALGTKCPFHAHSRKMNSRNAEVFDKNRLITRRGVPFDHNVKNSSSHNEKGQGLFFISYQKSIINQFEYLNHLGVSDRFEISINDFIRSGRDPIFMYQKKKSQEAIQKWNLQWGVTTSNRQGFKIIGKDIISLKGGEYFYAPSISFLKSLVGLKSI